MAVLSAAQIKSLLIANTGWRGKDLDTAVAIAMAESGGNPQAYNPELASSYSRPGAGSRGLFQIFGAVHPKYNSAVAFDPAVNARGAYEIYQQAGNKFTPWSAYTQGTYTKYLGSVPTSGANVQTKKITGGSLGAVSGSAAGVATETSWMPNLEIKLPEVDWLSLGFIIGGVVLVIIGLVILGVLLTKDIAPEIAGATIKAAL